MRSIYTFTAWAFDCFVCLLFSLYVFYEGLHGMCDMRYSSLAVVRAVHCTVHGCMAYSEHSSFFMASQTSTANKSLSPT